MPKFTTIARRSRALTKPCKPSLAGVAGLGAASLAFTLMPGGGQATADAATSVAPVAYSEQQTKAVKDIEASVTGQPVRSAVKAEAVAAKTYSNNLDGWIRESLDIMKKHKIPGSYQGLYKNIMRESSGNPNAINNWDINARNGVPSIGLLQVIKPTFDAYHVPGTARDQYNPVANITAAANYAADRYGSIDNVNSAY